MKLWEQRDFQNYKGKDLTHAQEWAVISDLRKRKLVTVEHVKSHTKCADFEHTGNREVDSLAQDRKDYPETVRAIFTNAVCLMPTMWETADGVVVPISEADNILSKIHTAIGHCGQVRTRKWLEKLDIKIPNFAERFSKLKAGCEACANKGGVKKQTHTPGRIKVDKQGEHYSCDMAGPFDPSTKGNKYFW